MRIVIDLGFSPFQRRLMRAAVVSGVVVAGLGLGVAIASPTTFVSGDPVSADKLNGTSSGAARSRTEAPRPARWRSGYFARI
jgi:hypothetical protein